MHLSGGRHLYIRPWRLCYTLPPFPPPAPAYTLLPKCPAISRDRSQKADR
jgi:hypothetical protein